MTILIVLVRELRSPAVLAWRRHAPGAGDPGCPRGWRIRGDRSGAHRAARARVTSIPGGGPVRREGRPRSPASPAGGGSRHPPGSARAVTSCRRRTGPAAPRGHQAGPVHAPRPRAWRARRRDPRPAVRAAAVPGRARPACVRCPSGPLVAAACPGVPRPGAHGPGARRAGLLPAPACPSYLAWHHVHARPPGCVPAAAGPPKTDDHGVNGRTSRMKPHGLVGGGPRPQASPPRAPPGAWRSRRGQAAAATRRPVL